MRRGQKLPSTDFFYVYVENGEIFSIPHKGDLLYRSKEGVRTSWEERENQQTKEEKREIQKWKPRALAQFRVAFFQRTPPMIIAPSPYIEKGKIGMKKPRISGEKGVLERHSQGAVVVVHRHGEGEPHAHKEGQKGTIREKKESIEEITNLAQAEKRDWIRPAILQ